MWETIKTRSLENEGVCFPRGRGKITSMASCKTAVTPLLTHWSYCNLALSHRHDIWILKSGWDFVVDLPGNMRFKHAPLIWITTCVLPNDMVISWDDNHHMFMENTMLLMQLIFLCGSAIIRINLRRRRWTIVSIDILQCFSFRIHLWS